MRLGTDLVAAFASDELAIDPSCFDEEPPPPGGGSEPSRRCPILAALPPPVKVKDADTGGARRIALGELGARARGGCQCRCVCVCGTVASPKAKAKAKSDPTPQPEVTSSAVLSGTSPKPLVVDPVSEALDNDDTVVHERMGATDASGQEFARIGERRGN